MNAVLNDDFKSKIIELYMKEKTVEKLFMFENAPFDKLRNATASYAQVMGNDEAVIFLYDDTVWGSSKDGFILTTKRLYKKNYLETAVFSDVSGIVDMSIRYGVVSSNIDVKTLTGGFNITVTQTDKLICTTVFNMLKGAVALLKNPDGAPVPGPASSSQQKRVFVCSSCGAPNNNTDAICDYCGILLK